MIIIFVLYHFVNIGLGKWNAVIVQHRIDSGNPKQIEHFWWGLMYGALCLPWYWVYGHNFMYVLALVPLHLSIFAPAYNSYRGLARFNLSKTSKAITDKTLVKMGFKSMEIPCAIAEVISIILLLISIL